jgi:hypothetical protein
MIIPGWYHDFWCPPDMRKADPQGCGIGLGIGAWVLIILLVAVLLAVGVLASTVIGYLNHKKEG